MRRSPGGWAVAATALAVLTGAGLTGCGIPPGTSVRVDGPLPEIDSPQTSENPVLPPGPDQADSEVELVDNFLQAAAANPEDPVEVLREFVHQDDRGTWQPDPQILVVRADESVSTPGQQVRVQVPVHEIGVLTEDGTIEPRDVTQPRTLEFKVVPVADMPGDADVASRVEQRFQLVDPPDEIILSTSALGTYLLPRPVYYWGTEGEMLVPDLRWLPSALPVRQRAQTVMKWLGDGPAAWLPGALVGLPDDVTLAGNVVWSADRLEVPLTSASGEVDGRRLDAQLWWTLRPDLSGNRTLVLVVDGAERVLDGDYLALNPAAGPDPLRFAVLDGVVRQLRPDQEQDLPALAGGLNEEIHSAALSRDRRFAALVRAEPEERLRLSVARAAGLTESDLVADRMSRPAWLAGGTVGLVVADGQLYRFDETATVSRVRVPGGLTGIQAVAAAPDARRVALVASGRLYVASLVWRAGSFSMNEPRVLPTTAGDLEGVGFLQENWLAFVGDETGRSLLYEITVDGALERPLPNGEPGAPVSVDSFTAYPGDPTGQSARGKIMYEAENRAYVYAHGILPALIEAGDLYGVPADAEPGEPRAPFFLD
ncbi:MAG: hypothetical protein GEV12_22600 [Micromonosporaceae bacterium]|nr:hypothetical protein [Micromonosporaceae bacterium]